MGFLADDDIVLSLIFYMIFFCQSKKYGIEAVSVSCLRENKKSFNTIVQWQSFGSGCSIVTTTNLNKCTFGLGYEFGLETAILGCNFAIKGLMCCI
jgi:hypothetical protein